MKKLYNKKILILCDLLAIPATLFCRWLTGAMLATESPCLWTLFGFQCATCGGTHFASSLLHGRIGQAWHHNEFLFLLAILAVVVWVLVHLHLLCRAQWAGRVLRRVFSFPAVILLLAGTGVFLLIRNWAALLYWWGVIFH